MPFQSKGGKKKKEKLSLSLVFWMKELGHHVSLKLVTCNHRCGNTATLRSNIWSFEEIPRQFSRFSLKESRVEIIQGLTVFVKLRHNSQATGVKPRLPPDEVNIFHPEL